MTEYIRPASDSFLTFDPSRVPSPCFVVDEAAVERNLQILADFQERSGAKVLLALKAFGMYSLGPLFKKYLAGTCASGLAEARLGREEFGGEVHVFSAAYKNSDLSEIMKIADHVILNSLGQRSENYRMQGECTRSCLKSTRSRGPQSASMANHSCSYQP